MKVIKSTGYIDYDVQLGDHIVQFYDSDEQRSSVLVEYIKDAIRENHKCLCILDKDMAAALQDRLLKLNMDLGFYLIEGQILFMTHEEFYMNNGQFDDEKLAKLIVEATETAGKQGWAALRIANDFTWAVADNSNVDAWLRFEAAINNYLGKLPAIMLCQYNQRMVSGQIANNLIKTHPYVILGEEIHENPFFIRPEKFLKGYQPEGRFYT